MYDLDVSVDGGPWQRVLTRTTVTTYSQQTNQPANYYTFRLTATDHVSNAASALARTSVVRVTKYYYREGTRVALRTSGAGGSVVYWLHGDHLGSVSLVTDHASRIIAQQRFLPYGGVRYSEGTLPTDVGFTGHRGHPALGLVYMRARYYHVALGRFVSADTVVPEPGNPQSLNRFSYVLGNPLRYIDPSGHFEEDEIRRYLEHYFAGITDDDEREKKIEGILRQWKADEEWWSIIGPGGATYGDVLNSTRLLLGRPTSTLRGTFTHDLMHDTFMFSGKETFLEMPPMFGDYGSYGYYDEFYSLVDFYNETDDIIWGRPGSEGQLVYMGGTGYAANGAPLRWDKLADSIGRSGKATLAGFTGMGFLGAPEPTLITKALALVAFGVCGYEVWQGNIDNAQFARSISAAIRRRDFENP